MSYVAAVCASISIHALREEGDNDVSSPLLILVDFYPRPPRGGRPCSAKMIQTTGQFLSTPSARRATFLLTYCATYAYISIHALREEGDQVTDTVGGVDSDFYPRPPRGGRQKERLGLAQRMIFLSTPSARRATPQTRRRTPHTSDFYPRPPRGGRRVVSERLTPVSYFYPRPPRGGRPGGLRRDRAPADFYPRPPRGGRLDMARQLGLITEISIHALREEGDPGISEGSMGLVQFLSTPSARRATAKTETKSLFSNKLYNILHEFRRALIYNGSKNYPNHAK